MIFLQPSWVLAFVCAYVLYGAGQFEARDGARNNRMLWAGLSIALSAGVIQVFRGSWLSVLLAQAGLFVGIGIFRALRESKSGVTRPDREG
ncbi:MAG TPA: hypothetical protein VHV80_09020 [Steroidobacteraceae bacterium]|nr:hypothetical protein [Steroidobacteraceae bacterium]